jgi:hypothetical protein
VTAARTARARVLDALETADIRGATTAELCQPSVGGIRFGARLYELREMGYVILTRPVRRGSYRYVLLGRLENR